MYREFCRVLSIMSIGLRMDNQVIGIKKYTLANLSFLIKISGSTLIIRQDFDAVEESMLIYSS